MANHMCAFDQSLRRLQQRLVRLRSKHVLRITKELDLNRMFMSCEEWAELISARYFQHVVAMASSATL